MKNIAIKGGCWYLWPMGYCGSIFAVLVSLGIPLGLSLNVANAQDPQNECEQINQRLIKMGQTSQAPSVADVQYVFENAKLLQNYGVCLPEGVAAPGVVGGLLRLLFVPEWSEVRLAAYDRLQQRPSSASVAPASYLLSCLYESFRGITSALSVLPAGASNPELQSTAIEFARALSQISQEPLVALELWSLIYFYRWSVIENAKNGHRDLAEKVLPLLDITLHQKPWLPARHPKPVRISEGRGPLADTDPLQGRFRKYVLQFGFVLTTDDVPDGHALGRRVFSEILQDQDPRQNLVLQRLMALTALENDIKPFREFITYAQLYKHLPQKSNYPAVRILRALGEINNDPKIANFPAKVARHRRLITKLLSLPGVVSEPVRKIVTDRLQMICASVL